MSIVLDRISPDDAKPVNEAILQWVPKVRSALKSSAKRFSHGKEKPFIIRGQKSGNIRQEGHLAESIKAGTKATYGQIDLVSFTFERHGVFVHKGVGRGYPIGGKGEIKDPSGRGRQPVEWFNPELEKYAPELANRLADINADLALNTAYLHIQ